MGVDKVLYFTNFLYSHIFMCLRTFAHLFVFWVVDMHFVLGAPTPRYPFLCCVSSLHLHFLSSPDCSSFLTVRECSIYQACVTRSHLDIDMQRVLVTHAWDLEWPRLSLTDLTFFDLAYGRDA